MQTNDLPIQHRLAALIETGRACNPDLEHGQGDLLNGSAACAIGFAALAAGLPRDAIRTDNKMGAQINRAYAKIGKTLGLHEKGSPPQALQRWVWSLVIRPNDNGFTLEQICASLRAATAKDIEAEAVLK